MEKAYSVRSAILNQKLRPNNGTLILQLIHHPLLYASLCFSVTLSIKCLRIFLLYVAISFILFISVFSAIYFHAKYRISCSLYFFKFLMLVLFFFAYASQFDQSALPHFDHFAFFALLCKSNNFAL